MALLTAGYWQTTYNADGYWHEDYWQDYGAGVPSGAARKHWMFGPVIRALIFGLVGGYNAGPKRR